MTSGVNELEAFIAALRLSFLISPATPGSPESLQQGIATFRETLRPRTTSATSSESTEDYALKQDDARHSGTSVFTQAGEPISSTSTAWSCDDRIDRTKQIGLVNSATEVREGTSEIRDLIWDLIQTAKELREEVMNLPSVLATSNNVVPGSAVLSAATPQPPSSAAPNNSIPSFASLISSFTASKPLQKSLSKATELQTLPSAPSLLQALSPIPHQKKTLGPAYPPTTVPVEPVCPSEPISPVTEDVPGLSLAGESVAKEMGSKACVSDDKSQPEVEAQHSEGNRKYRLKSLGTATVAQREIADTRRGIFPARYVKEIQHPDVQEMLDDEDDSDYSEITEPGPKSAIIMISVSSFNTSRPGELRFGRGKRVTIIDAPNTPSGWLYGEIVAKRRGLFLDTFIPA
ncbi:hypothetical protein FS837_001364 [Tulasnella sp. UAMH 9824]|nr:hypothetical protein FS837_001364 [Tulasnella sp. UAMH 9824]